MITYDSVILWDDSFVAYDGLIAAVEDPSYVFEEEINYRIDINTFETGTEQRHARGRPKRVWTLRYDDVDQTKRDSIHDLFEGVLGAYGAFPWVNPLDNVTYNVRFANDVLDEENIAYDETNGHRFNIQIAFVEVI